MKKISPLILLVFFSCSDKKLNERRSTLEDLEISRYEVSLLTSVHDHVDVTKDGKTEHILKTNTGDIDSIYLLKDTLVIKTLRRPVVYEKKDKVFGYFVKIDSIRRVVEDTIYGIRVNKFCIKD
jgi:hypothetical protein